MPSSSLLAAPRVINFVWEIQQQNPLPLRVLDVGPGWGKYERLLREYIKTDLQIDAIEMWAPYVESFGLMARYDHLIIGDICNQPVELLALYDVVLMVDVLEHIETVDALQLLARIPGWVVVCTPRDFFHNPHDCPSPETHRSHWTVEEFQAMDRFDVYAPEELQSIGAVIVRLKPWG